MLDLLVRILDISVDVASALECLHEDEPLPIIHCDLKPSNILLNDDMVAHVGDFGLARFYLLDFHVQQQDSTCWTFMFSSKILLVGLSCSAARFYLLDFHVQQGHQHSARKSKVL
jgi:serine/threonine protein kinase